MNLFGARIRRFIALWAALLFLVASSAYAAHQHQNVGAQNGQAQCDFCLQFSATVDAPSAPTLQCPIELLVQVQVLSLEKTALPERKARAHGSRAPPVLSIA